MRLLVGTSLLSLETDATLVRLIGEDTFLPANSTKRREREYVDR